MQHGFLYIAIYIHRFAVPEMLDTAVIQSFVSYKLTAKLPATVQTTMPLTATLPMGKTIVATLIIQFDILINNFIYM